MKITRLFQLWFSLLLLFMKAATGEHFTGGCKQSPCLAANGLFPVPDDCRSFFNCAHCIAFRQQCGPGTAFDAKLHICNHEHLVESCHGEEKSTLEFDERSSTQAHRETVNIESHVFSNERAAVGSGSSSNRQPGSEAEFQIPYPSLERRTYPSSNHEQGGPQLSYDKNEDSFRPEERTSVNSDKRATTEPRRWGSLIVDANRQHDEQGQAQPPEESQERPRDSDKKAVAISSRSLFNHSHISHHPEAVPYLQSHQVVYDHSHEGHHSGQGEDKDHLPNDHSPVPPEGHPQPQHFSPKNLGSHSPQYDSSREQTTTVGTSSGSVSAQNGTTAPAASGFDLKGRNLSNSGYVPRYVQEQMEEGTESKPAQYGEREFVRTANKNNSSDSAIRDLRGQETHPARFYTDDLSTPSHDSPVYLSADDLRQFQRNQAAHNVQRGKIPYVELSSNPSRQLERRSRQPEFQGQSQSPFFDRKTAEASDNREVRAAVYVEHKRLKANHVSATADMSGRSVFGGGTGVADEPSESRQDVRFVSAPPLPTPLPLLTDERTKEFVHMGYRFDHDPLREKVKSFRNKNTPP